MITRGFAGLFNPRADIARQYRTAAMAWNATRAEALADLAFISGDQWQRKAA